MHELDEEALSVAHDTTNFSGPKRHFLIYPIGANYRTLNIVAFIPEPRHKDESWTSQGTLADLARELDGWNPSVRSIVDTWKKLQNTTMKQALYEHEPLDKWTDGHLVVMGDAAHAMLPHQGQGTGQAIEDGVILALCLQGVNAENIHKRLELYFRLRKERTDRVVNTSREAGRIASSANPDKRTPVDLDAMKKRWQWLWKHDVFEAFEAEKAKYF
jgi:salicylate hydroxylase